MMSALRQRLFSRESARQWLYGGALAVAAALFVVLPAAQRLRRSMHSLSTERRTYAGKVSWAANREEMAQRVRECEAEVAELDARLLDGAEVAELTESIAKLARKCGCAVRSIRPLEPRVLGLADEGEGETPPAREREGDGGPRTEFLEWPLRMAVRGEYAQVCSLLESLAAGPRSLCLTRLELYPCEGDRERLSCELEIVGGGLRRVKGNEG
ncbi:MAG: hypothetical protein ACLF0G_11560 [Candidatus Brocadiia bacterium]